MTRGILNLSHNSFTMETETIILVDKGDKEIGYEEKMKAHENGGKLHRAFSIFVFDSKGRMLLQKRAEGKYHCSGLWTNTCCSHPNKGETLDAAVHRKLEQEFGFDCPLNEVFSFIYKAGFDNGLTEYEFDHVFVGRYDGKTAPNPEEIGDWKFVSVDELRKDLEKHPEKYTPWFKESFERVVKAIEDR